MFEVNVFCARIQERILFLFVSSPAGRREELKRNQNPIYCLHMIVTHIVFHNAIIYLLQNCGEDEAIRALEGKNCLLLAFVSNSRKELELEEAT